MSTSSKASVTRNDPATVSVISDADLDKEIELSQMNTRLTTKSDVIVTLPFRQLIVIIGALSLAMFLSALDQTIVATALPVIASEFNQLNLISWVITAYMLTSVAFQPLYGKLLDIFGRLPMMLFAIGIFLVGSLLCALSTSMVMLIVARAVAGIGGGGILAVVMVIMSDIVAIEERGKYNGILGSMFVVANIVGPLLGGVFTDQLTWNWAFWINLPIGAVTLIVIVLFLRLPSPGGNIRDKLKRIDYLGSFLIIGAVVCVLLALSWGGKEYAWNSATIIGLFCGGGALIILLILFEGWVAVEPVLPIHLFKVRNVSLVALVNFTSMMAFITLIVYMPVYFQVVHDATATNSGLQLMPLMVTVIIFAALSGILMEKTTLINIWIQGGLAILTVGVGLLYTLQVSSTKGQEIGYLIICGVGLGCAAQSTLLAAQAATRVRDLAVVTTISRFFQTIGGVIGVAISSAVFNNRLSSELQANLANLPGITPQILYGIENSVEVLRKMPLPIQTIAKEAYMTAIQNVFLVSIPFVIASFLFSLFLENKRLVRSPNRTHEPAMV
jgi:EmrB/QacA subfamily drug resistance transporter